MRKLQCIQNSAARIVTNTSRFCNITPTLKKLHWLPVEHRSIFKTATLIYTSFYTLGAQNILIHIFSHTVVITIPDVVKM